MHSSSCNLLENTMDGSDVVFNGNMCFVCHLTIKEKELKKCSSCKLIFYCSVAHQKIHWKHHRPLCKVITKIDLTLKPENVADSSAWFKYRSNLLVLCELKIGRKLKLNEINMILFPNNCQVCHKKFNLQPCLNCLCVNYCSEDHKLVELASHKDVCHLLALCLELDLYMEKNHIYPQYFLKDGDFCLNSMEEFIKNNIEIERNDKITYLQERALTSELITCPLSLLFILEQIKYCLEENAVIHVVGSSFLETASLKSWEIIVHKNPNIKNLSIHFIGPEVEKNDEYKLCISCNNKLKFQFSSDFYHDYVLRPYFQNPDVICSFNCGFHEFENSESDTWSKTLPLLIQNENVPLIFTSFTRNESERDSESLKKVNEKLEVKIMKNKFSSLRPYRDLENLEVFFNNGYIGFVSNDLTY